MIDKNWFNENDYRKVVSMYNNSKLDFQRFEFLGDRVLGLALAENLMTRFSEYDEGKLAKIFSYLSSRKVLVKIGKKNGLLTFLKENNLENISDRILSDFVEAILGFFFFNHGYDKTKAIIINYWNEEIINDFHESLDYKTNLQEWSQGKKLGLPKYTLVKKEGPDHKPLFKVIVEIKNYKSEVGLGNTLQLAEQKAAKNFISSNSLIYEK